MPAWRWIIGLIISPTMDNFEVKNDFARRWEERRKEELAFESRQVEERFRASRVNAGILTLDIEPTNCCNLRCRMCARTVLGYDRQERVILGFMDFALYQRVVREAVELGAVSLRLAWYGEPLLHPQIGAMVSYAKACGLRDVGLNTNATRLNEEMTLTLLRSGLDRIVFSIDSPYPKQYESIRVGAKFEEVLANIRRFRRLRDELGIESLLTRANLVIMKENAHALDDYVALLKDHVDVVATGSFHDFQRPPAGFDADTLRAFRCPYLWLGMVVAWNGSVYVCSIDAGRQYPVGDATRESLGSIWVGDKYAQMRDLHRASRWCESPICARCNLVELFLEHYDMPSPG